MMNPRIVLTVLLLSAFFSLCHAAGTEEKFGTQLFEKLGAEPAGCPEDLLAIFSKEDVFCGRLGSPDEKFVKRLRKAARRFDPEPAKVLRVSRDKEQGSLSIAMLAGMGFHVVHYTPENAALVVLRPPYVFRT